MLSARLYGHIYKRKRKKMKTRRHKNAHNVLTSDTHGQKKKRYWYIPKRRRRPSGGISKKKKKSERRRRRAAAAAGPALRHQ